MNITSPKIDDLSLQKVLSFARRFGEFHIILAMHAALPLGLTPEIVHLIRINFVPDSPWIAEADLLLSPLCREVGGDLFEMDQEIREILLDDLKADAEFGPRRIREISEFLLAYVERKKNMLVHPDMKEFIMVQELVAISYIDPQKAAVAIAEKLKASSSESNEELKKLETIKIARLTRELTEPLYGEEKVLLYSAGMQETYAGNFEEANSLFEALDWEDNFIEIGHVKLEKPELPILPPMESEARQTESVPGKPGIIETETSSDMMGLEYLIQNIMKGNVIPIIGNDLSLVIGEDNKPKHLYEYIAREITIGDNEFDNLYNIHEMTLKPHADKIPHIHQKIMSVYEYIKLSQKIYKKPLEYLAKITDFNFYVSTAIDDILEEAIRSERNCTDGELEVINYSLQPKSPKPVTPKITVFKLMGDIHYPEHAAIDEEKMSEHIVSLANKDDNPLAMYLAEHTKGKMLLYIGCDFQDGFMRFFIRLIRGHRFMHSIFIDYFIDDRSDKSPGLKNFLQHNHVDFIKMGVGQEGNARAFIDRLYKEWAQRKAEAKTTLYKGTVFISYHGKDVRSAENLKNKLEAEGISVWSDKRDLAYGEHEKNIRQTISKDCRVFIPLISENLLEQPEHYARRVEWSMAEKINETIPFTNLQFDIIPCIVDDSNCTDDRIPEFIKKFKIFDLNAEEVRIINAIKTKLKPINME